MAGTVAIELVRSYVHARLRTSAPAYLRSYALTYVQGRTKVSFPIPLTLLRWRCRVMVSAEGTDKRGDLR
jgi:hypothetical protein